MFIASFTYFLNELKQIKTIKTNLMKTYTIICATLSIGSEE